MDEIDYRAMAEELRHRRDRLTADLPALDGWEADAARATLGWVDRVLAAIASGDQAAITELLRQGEAASRALHPEREHLN